MSGKQKPKEGPAPGQKPEEGPSPAPAPTPRDTFEANELMARASGITPVERAKLRVKCIEAAMITRTAAMPIKSHIVAAREIEAYVLDPECHLPVPEASEDGASDTEGKEGEKD